MPSRHSSLAIDSPVRSPRRSQSSRGAKDSPRASTSSSSRIRTPTKQHRRAICESDLDDSDDEAHSPPRSSKKDKEADRTKSNGKGKASRRDEDEDDPDELISDTNDDEDDDEEEEEYEIESILRHKLDKKTGAWQFLVHWAGYSSDWDTWEPEDNLKATANEVLEAYWEKVREVEKKSKAITAAAAARKKRGRGVGSASPNGEDSEVTGQSDSAAEPSSSKKSKTNGSVASGNSSGNGSTSKSKAASKPNSKQGTLSRFLPSFFSGGGSSRVQEEDGVASSETDQLAPPVDEQMDGTSIDDDGDSIIEDVSRSVIKTVTNAASAAAAEAKYKIKKIDEELDRVRPVTEEEDDEEDVEDEQDHDDHLAKLRKRFDAVDNWEGMITKIYTVVPLRDVDNFRDLFPTSKEKQACAWIEFVDCDERLLYPLVELRNRAPKTLVDYFTQHLKFGETRK